jgi:hypothetical protein
VTSKFVSVLDKIGALGKDIWKVAEKAAPVAEEVAEVAEPGLAIMFPVLGPLWNMTETLIKTAEASAGAAGAQKAGKQKAALVMASLLPYAVQDAQKLGILPPTTAQMQTWIDGSVIILKAFGAI